MNISDNGIAKIEGYEGYHDRLPDGSCKAYQRTYNGKLDVPTIGYGCTEGVKMGMVWSKDQADAAFRKELAKFENGVTRLVTVDLNQNEFDALVSLTYNIGLGAFGRSSVLSKLNRNDRAGAAKAFLLWNRAGGGVVRGLVQRRTSEMNLFLKPVSAEPLPAMPQTVSASREPVSKKAVATVASGTATGLTLLAQNMPADPLGTAEKAVSTGQRVQAVAEQSSGLMQSFGSMGHATGVGFSVLLAAGICVGAYWVFGHWLPSKFGSTS